MVVPNYSHESAAINVQDCPELKCGEEVHLLADAPSSSTRQRKSAAIWVAPDLAKLGGLL